MGTSNLEDMKRSLELLKMIESEERRFLMPYEDLKEEEWSDKIFQEEYIDKFPVFKRPTIAEFANAARAFLNTYMTGEVQSVDYEKVLLTLFGGMKIDTDYLGAEKFHSSVGDESPKSLYVSEASIIEDLEPQFSPSVGKGTRAQGGQVQASLSVPTITVDEAKKWYNNLMNLLSEKIPDSAESKEDAQWKTERKDLAANYVGLLALKTMRAIVKNEAQTVAHIMKSQNLHFTRLWQNCLICDVPPPPHLHFLDRVNPFIKRYSASSIRLLTYLIGSYLSDTVSVRRRVLHATIVLPLRLVTMRGINWLFRAAECLDWDIDKLLKCFEDEMGSAVKDEIANVHNFFLGSDSPKKSWVWARLFRDRAALSISCKRLPIISMVSAAIIYGQDPSHFIWKTAQFEEVVKDDTKFKFGLRMAKIITQKRSKDRFMEVPLTPQAAELFLLETSEYLSDSESS